MGKIAGLRVNLDEVERALNSLGEEFAVVAKGEGLLLYHLPNADEKSAQRMGAQAAFGSFHFA